MVVCPSQRHLGWLFPALCLGVVTACSAQPDPAPATSTHWTPPTMPILSASPDASVTPTSIPDHPSPSPSSTLTEEQAAAAATVMEFFRLKNELGHDPEASFQPLTDITTGQTRQIQESTLVEYREQNLIQIGQTHYKILGVGEVFESPQTDARISVNACTDASEVDVVDRETELSVLPDARPRFIGWNIEVVKLGSVWKVGDILSGEVDEC